MMRHPITLLVIGVAAGCSSDEAKLTATPAAIGFAAIAVGSASVVVAAVANVGDASTGPLTVSAAGDFALDPESGCAGVSLDAGASCNIGVVFEPVASGTRSGFVVVFGADGGDVELALVGSGVLE